MYLAVMQVSYLTSLSQRRSYLIFAQSQEYIKLNHLFSVWITRWIFPPLCPWLHVLQSHWHKIGLYNPGFFSTFYAHDWIKEGANISRSTLFLAGLWWTWRHRNLMYLGNETWSLTRLSININNSVDIIRLCLQNVTSTSSSIQYVWWNNNGLGCTILNFDGSCIWNPIWAGFGGVICNSSSNYLSGISGTSTTSKTFCWLNFLLFIKGSRWRLTWKLMNWCVTRTPSSPSISSL